MAAEPVAEIELRVLDGPNLYFPRPAIKLTLSAPGWMRASGAKARGVASSVGLGRSFDPGPPGSDRRRRAGGRLAAHLTRRIAAAGGVRRLAVRSRTGPGERIVIAFPWRRRAAAEALARETASAMAALLRGRSAERRIRDAGDRLLATEPGPGPTVPDPAVPVIQVTGTNGKTTTVRLVAHIARACGRRVAYSSTDGVYRDDARLVEAGDYSGFGGAARALADDPDLAVLETARGGLLLRGSGVLHNDVAVVTNVSADHLGLQGIETVDQLAEVKGIITRITRPQGWAVLNGDDPRVLAMRRHAAGRTWIVTMDPHHPAIREVLADGGRATTVSDGRISWLQAHDAHPLVALEDVPLTLAGVSRANAMNAMSAATASLAVGLPTRGVVRGLRTFVLDPRTNPGRANLFRLRDRIVVIDYAHNEAGVEALCETLAGLRGPGADIWLTVCTAGDRSDDILRGFAFRAAVGSDRLGFAELRRYLRGRPPEALLARMREGAAEAGVHDVDVYPDELRALQATVRRAAPHDVVAVTALGMRPEIFRWLRRRGAAPLGPSDVKRLVRKARR